MKILERTCPRRGSGLRQRRIGDGIRAGPFSFSGIKRRLGWIRRVACRGQRGYVGDRTGSPESDPPRLITDLRKRVEKGTSGGISLFGTFASLLGASAIALPAAWFSGNWSLLPLIAFAGLAGSLFDSLLGATMQAMYYCPTDQKETEKHPLHTCGALTVHVRGWRWLDNDWVNFACGAFGITVAILVVVIS
jgi:uncharacterized membrane protein